MISDWSEGKTCRVLSWELSMLTHTTSWHKSLDCLVLPQPAYLCWFVALTDKQSIRVLTFVSVTCWIWLDPVWDLEGRWRNLFYCGCWQSFFTPLLKCCSCLPDVCSDSMLTRAKQVNRITSPLCPWDVAIDLDLKNYHPSSLSWERSDRFIPFCPFWLCTETCGRPARPFGSERNG